MSRLPIRIWDRKFQRWTPDDTERDVLQNVQSSPGGNNISTKEYRTGSITVTIAANNLRGSAIVTLSPPLLDGKLSNYKVQSTVNDTAQAWSGDANLSSVTSLSIAAYRMPTSTGNTGNAATGVTVAGNDLTDVSGMAVSNPEPGTVTGAHGADAGFIGHGHTTAGHPVTDPQHLHTGGLPSTAAGAINVNVDWSVTHI